MVEIAYREIQGGGPPSCYCLNRYISAAYCSILLKFGTKVDQITTDTLQSFKIRGSEVKVTA